MCGVSVLFGVCDLFKYMVNRVLVFGIGGGGDVVTAAALALWLKRYGVEAFIGSIAWERFVIDPLPGPIPFNSFHNVDRVSEHVLVSKENTYVVRGSRKFRPQVAWVAEAIKKPIYVLDLWDGVYGYKEGIKELIEYLGIDAIIALDVGGDVLAKGDEENLWSPLADSMGLACFNSFNNTVLTVHGLGSDGELSPDYLLSRIALIAKENGLLGAKGLTSYEADLIERILLKATSEASKIPLLAYRGFYGEYTMRNGTRKVWVSPLHTITFFLDIHIAYKLSPIAKIVDNTKTLNEANIKLNTQGIYTEYNLEKDLLKYKNISSNPQAIIRIRRKYRDLLKKRYGK